MLLSAFFLASQAHAFCGTYVGGAGSELYNEYSQVAIVREGDRTTLSIVNDIQGEFDEFALVIPVPEVLAEDAVHTLDPAIFARLEEYSQPRLVSYVCDDFLPERSYGVTVTSEGLTDAEHPSADTVVIEAQYVVGEYDIAILSAEDSGGLFDWLNANGYAIPEASVSLLGDYIDAGSYFFAAKVRSDAGIADGDTLSPLQFSYAAEVFSLPIRIGTLNSKSAQDLVIYGMNPHAEGRLQVANYPEIAVEDECLWDSEGEDFGAFYAAQFEEAYEAAGSAVWATEYAWSGGTCDPCPGASPYPEDLVTLGLSEERIHYSEYFFTRLHLRYTPAQAHSDLSLYLSGITDHDQMRYVQYEDYLEDQFPVCGEGWAGNPGTCFPPDVNGAWPFPGCDSGEGGCNAASGLAGGWLAALLAALRRRSTRTSR